MGDTSLPQQYGISPRQFDHWCRLGLVHCTQDGVGTGYPRRLAPGEDAVLRDMVVLVRAGMAPRPAAQLARLLVADGLARLGDSHLYVMESPRSEVVA
jgi:hypothetical protein